MRLNIFKCIKFGKMANFGYRDRKFSVQTYFWKWRSPWVLNQNFFWPLLYFQMRLNGVKFGLKDTIKANSECEMIAVCLGSLTKDLLALNYLLTYPFQLLFRSEFCIEKNRIPLILLKTYKKLSFFSEWRLQFL